MKAEGVQAVFLLPEMMLANAAAPIATLALQHHLPTMAWGGWFTETGLVVSVAKFRREPAIESYAAYLSEEKARLDHELELAADELRAKVEQLAGEPVPVA